MLLQNTAGLTAESVWHRHAEIVAGIREGDEAATGALYNEFAEGIRILIFRHLGSQDTDDRVQEVFLALLTAIRKGNIRYPERLAGFVRTIAQRTIAAQIGERSHARRNYIPWNHDRAEQRLDPEAAVLAQERINIARRILAALPSKHCEILTRFYLREQPAEQICREMGITATEFRLVKSRAKLRFEQLVQNRFRVKRHRDERRQKFGCT